MAQTRNKACRRLPKAAVHFALCNEKFLVAYLSSLSGANSMMSGHAASSYS